MVKYIVRDISKYHSNIGGIFMRKNDKKQRILDKIENNLNFCDRIVMKVLNNYTIKIYRIGLNDAFNWENQKYKKNNLHGCTTAVQLFETQK